MTGLVAKGGRQASHGRRRGELTPRVGAFYTKRGFSPKTLETAIIKTLLMIQGYYNDSGYDRRRVTPLAAHIVESNIKYPNLFGVTFWKDKRTTEKVRNLQCEKYR